MKDWTLSVENRATVTVVYIDYKRAIDMVPHDKLLYKIRVIIRGSMTIYPQWIDNFLKNRTQATRVG